MTPTGFASGVLRRLRFHPGLEAQGSAGVSRPEAGLVNDSFHQGRFTGLTALSLELQLQVAPRARHNQESTCGRLWGTRSLCSPSLLPRAR
jgi:hypothetical protein